jgi:hypothetical protein
MYHINRLKHGFTASAPQNRSDPASRLERQPVRRVCVGDAPQPSAWPPRLPRPSHPHCYDHRAGPSHQTFDEAGCGNGHQRERPKRGLVPAPAKSHPNPHCPPHAMVGIETFKRHRCIYVVERGMMYRQRFQKCRFSLYPIPPLSVLLQYAAP